MSARFIVYTQSAAAGGWVASFICLMRAEAGKYTDPTFILTGVLAGLFAAYCIMSKQR